jgi:GDPmannose 4,6-dehydratase
VQPDEIYNLAAQTHVQISFETPIYTAQTTGVGVLNLLEAVCHLGLKSKIYQASTSELYSGDPAQAPQNESTPFRPRSPYGVAKLYGFHIGRVYRESYGMFVSNGILFNHESERRGQNFVTRKITLGIRDILRGKTDKIILGNLDAKRDWGYAPEYVEAMWRMLQQDQPDDFVIATGETHTVREFLEEACRIAGLDPQKVVQIADRYKRPNEVDHLCGDPSKAKRVLGWAPKTTFKDLVRIMVEADLKDL